MMLRRTNQILVANGWTGRYILFDPKIRCLSVHSRWNHKKKLLQIRACRMYVPPRLIWIPLTWRGPVRGHVIIFCLFEYDVMDAGTRKWRDETQHAPVQGIQSVTCYSVVVGSFFAHPPWDRDSRTWHPSKTSWTSSFDDVSLDKYIVRSDDDTILGVTSSVVGW